MKSKSCFFLRTQHILKGGFKGQIPVSFWSEPAIGCLGMSREEEIPKHRQRPGQQEATKHGQEEEEHGLTIPFSPNVTSLAARRFWKLSSQGHIQVGVHMFHEWTPNNPSMFAYVCYSSALHGVEQGEQVLKMFKTNWDFFCQGTESSPSLWFFFAAMAGTARSHRRAMAKRNIVTTKEICDPNGDGSNFVKIGAVDPQELSNMIILLFGIGIGIRIFIQSLNLSLVDMPCNPHDSWLR